MAVKSSISLTDEQHAFARRLVEAGRYASLSAVLQQGVDLLRQRLDAPELAHAALRELVSRRRQGEFVSAQGMDTRLARMIADKRNAHGTEVDLIVPFRSADRPIPTGVRRRLDV